MRINFYISIEDKKVFVDSSEYASDGFVIYNDGILRVKTCDVYENKLLYCDKNNGLMMLYGLYASRNEDDSISLHYENLCFILFSLQHVLGCEYDELKSAIYDVLDTIVPDYEG